MHTFLGQLLLTPTRFGVCIRHLQEAHDCFLQSVKMPKALTDSESQVYTGITLFSSSWGFHTGVYYNIKMIKIIKMLTEKRSVASS
jgi:hypothetical protein